MTRNIRYTKIVHTTVYFVCYKTQKNKALKCCFLQMYNLHNSMYIFPLGDKFDKTNNQNMIANKYGNKQRHTYIPTCVSQVMYKH